MTERSRGWYAWGVAGIIFLFAEAAWRLGARGIATMRAGLSPLEWGVLAVLLGVLLYGEGYRALQRKWVPHAIRRLRGVSSRGRIHRILAPLYGMSLIGGPRRTTVRAWLGVTAIVTAILILRVTPDPWRGIVDVGVAAALLWGMVALLAAAVRTPPDRGD